MIIDRTPLSMNEVETILVDVADSDKKEEMKQHIKKFLKTKNEQAEKIKEALESSDILKLKKEHISKICDLLPSDSSDLNKIFVDVSLNEDETNKLLEIVKNSK